MGVILGCPVCGGEPEVCAEVGHEWTTCPHCGEDTRPSYATCPTCGEPRLTPADLPDTYCPDCGHPRTGCGCSSTGPGTCGGGTDDVEAGGLYLMGSLYLMSLMHDYWTGRPPGTLIREAHDDV